NGEEERAEQALDGAAFERRAWMSLKAFGYVFLLVLGGIVLVAAGMKLAVVSYNEPSTLATAVMLAVGVAAYAIGLVLFRLVLDSGRLVFRLLLASLALPTVWRGVALA